MGDATSYAVRSCPFLSQLAQREGVKFAQSIATDPTKLVGAAARGFEPLLPETMMETSEELLRTFRLFHGPQGVVPLAGFDSKAEDLSKRAGSCPYRCPVAPGDEAGVRAAPAGLPGLPLASMGISFGGGAHGFGDFLRRHLQQRNGRPRPVRRSPNGPHLNGSANTSSNSGPAGNSSSSGPSGRGSGGTSKPERGPAASRGAGSSPTSPDGGNPLHGSSGSSGGTRGSGSGPAQGGRSSPPPANSSSGAAPSAPGSGASPGGEAAYAGGSCPMRKWLGPMAGVVFNQYGRLQCPEPIVVARAALARTAPVRYLRPQKLPLKLIAVAATAAAVNIPCGAWREHFEKFSVGWFVAVHATIPFVAMLRKAVVMPKLAILVTIAAAVAGQVIGSRLERARLAQLRAGALPAAAPAAGPAAGLSTPKHVAAAGSPSSGSVSAVAAQQRGSGSAVFEAGLGAGLPGDDEDGSLHGQLSCVLASMTKGPRPSGALQASAGRLLTLPVSPLKV